MNLHRLGRARSFVAGSIIGGLALAFVIVFVHPQLLQRPAALRAPRRRRKRRRLPRRSADSACRPGRPRQPDRGTASAAEARARRSGCPQGSPGMPAESYAAAVRRAAPAVVNISTARLVTEQIQPSVFDSDVR